MWKLSKLNEMYDNKISENYSQNHEEIPNVPKMNKKNEEIKTEKNPHCMVCTGLYRSC